jgi:AraC family transcriptional regulator
MDAESAVRVESLDAFPVIGLEQLCEVGADNKIPALWDKLFERWEELPDVIGVYGICLPRTDGKPGFRYLASVKVEPGSATPEGMTTETVPAMRYAVFGFNDVVAQMPARFNEIYGGLLKQAGHEPHPSYQCLEYYAHDCYDEATKKIRADLYIGIV